jgi:hypothetical protein
MSNHTAPLRDIESRSTTRRNAFGRFLPIHFGYSTTLVMTMNVSLSSHHVYFHSSCGIMVKATKRAMLLVLGFIWAVLVSPAAALTSQSSHRVTLNRKNQHHCKNEALIAVWLPVLVIIWIPIPILIPIVQSYNQTFGRRSIDNAWRLWVPFLGIGDTMISREKILASRCIDRPIRPLLRPQSVVGARSEEPHYHVDEEKGGICTPDFFLHGARVQSQPYCALHHRVPLACRTVHLLFHLIATMHTPILSVDPRT